MPAPQFQPITNDIDEINQHFKLIFDYLNTLTQPAPGTSGVQSVNGKSGVVVLTKADIGLSAAENTADLAKPISTAVANALSNKADKGTSTGGGGSAPIPEVINLPETTWWKIFQTPYNGTVYSNGTKQGRWFMGGYRTNAGVNFSTKDRPDTVFTIAAYNIATPNGSREFPEEAGWDSTVETHYDNSGPKPYGDFEWHQRVYPTAAGEVRLHSCYVNKTNGQNRQDFTGNRFNFLTPAVIGNPFIFGNLEEAALDLFASGPGRVVGFSATDAAANGSVKVRMQTVGGQGFLQVPGFNYDSAKGLNVQLGQPVNKNDLYVDQNGFVKSKQ